MNGSGVLSFEAAPLATAPGGVVSVTGANGIFADNTDPANPIINFGTSTPTPAAWAGVRYMVGAATWMLYGFDLATNNLFSWGPGGQAFFDQVNNSSVQTATGFELQASGGGGYSQFTGAGGYVDQVNGGLVNYSEWRYNRIFFQQGPNDITMHPLNGLQQLISVNGTYASSLDARNGLNIQQFQSAPPGDWGNIGIQFTDLQDSGIFMASSTAQFVPTGGSYPAVGLEGQYAWLTAVQSDVTQGTGLMQTINVGSLGGFPSVNKFRWAYTDGYVGSVPTIGWTIQQVMELDFDGNLVIEGSLTTAAPGAVGKGNPGAAIRIGDIAAGAYTLDVANALTIEINGVSYNLALVN